MGKTSAPPQFPDGRWNDRVLQLMDLTHRLVLRRCAYLPFADVIRIDRKSLFAPEPKPERGWYWRVMFRAGPLPLTLVPASLVNDTDAYAIAREQRMQPFPEPNAAVFLDTRDEPITRESLRAAVDRALTLARLEKPLKPSTRTLCPRVVRSRLHASPRAIGTRSLRVIDVGIFKTAEIGEMAARCPGAGRWS